jgi:hypothetical protein
MEYWERDKRGTKMKMRRRKRVRKDRKRWKKKRKSNNQEGPQEMSERRLITILTI